MRVTLEELGWRCFGQEFGAWYWVPNPDTANPALCPPRTWSDAPGHHPFVLVRDCTGGPTVAVRPRSTTSRRGKPHPRHPAGHCPTCRIDRDGRLVRKRWSLSSKVLTPENFPCMEPDPGALRRLLCDRGDKDR